jgi:hypothetical protein
VIGLRFVLMTALVPLAGLWLRRLASVRALPRTARLCAYAGGGAVSLACQMFLFAVVGVPWSVWALMILPIAAAVIPSAARDLNHERRNLRSLTALGLTLAAILVLALAVLSATATSFDLLLFWGAKGQAFALARTIDVDFLKNPNNLLMHADYPPLLPMLYAWTMLGGERLDWFGAIATAPLLLLAATATIWGFTRSATLTALFAATFGFLFLDNNIAGNAEPLLLFFETLALGALVCAPACEVVAALALAGAVLTKVEGAAFAGVAVLLLASGRRRISLAPAIALASWIGFCAAHGLLDAYRQKAGGTITLAFVKPLLEQATMHSGYLPWLAVGLLIALGKPRRAWRVVAAALLYFAFLVAAWVGGGGDVATEVAWSARRVLMTPLLLLFFGAYQASDGDL